MVVVGRKGDKMEGKKKDFWGSSLRIDLDRKKEKEAYDSLHFPICFV